MLPIFIGNLVIAIVVFALIWLVLRLLVNVFVLLCKAILYGTVFSLMLGTIWWIAYALIY